jgi:hypothetical protein
MALTFGGATTDVVSVTDTDLDSHTAYTYLTWTYPTTQTGDRRLWRKNSNVGGQANQAVWNALDTNELRFVTFRATTNDLSISTGQNFALNTWHCFAFTHSAGSGNRIYYGTLGTNMAEVSYGTQTVGTGALVSDAGGALGIGNLVGGSTAWQGRISDFAYLNVELTLAEIQLWQFNPHNMAGTKLFHKLGSNGTTNVPDWSGNGCTGTVSGCSVSDDPPLRPWFGHDMSTGLYAPAAGSFQAAWARGANKLWMPGRAA